MLDYCGNKVMNTKFNRQRLRTILANVVWVLVLALITYWIVR